MYTHFIAIGGSAMHNLAIALVKKGVEVTGSDDVIFEPSRSRLERYGLLPATMGWDTNNITADLDAVILGMHARPDNPELLKARELGLRIYSYPEYVYEQAKEKLRVVIGGSHGKTTITSMILHVLKANNKDIDYLVGAQLEGFETMVRITRDAPVMVIEGDEYLASPIDRRPKFHLYRADIGVISGIAWDHINVFPTFENYADQFRQFLDTITPGGTIIYCSEDPLLNEMVKHYDIQLEKIPYQTPAYVVKDGVTGLVENGERVPLKVFGRHNLLNLTAARLVCGKLGVSDREFNAAISTFTGAAKRLEVIGRGAGTMVYKDFAHSPSKLTATTSAVKEQYPDRELIAVIELHTFSSLNRDFLKEYEGSMKLANEAIVFIDKHTFEQKKMQEFSESEVKAAFGDNKLKFFNNTETLERFLSSLNYKGKNLLLMSSGNFGGMNLQELAETAVNS
ncbi:UDP-N-acetylmuramate--L-alanine ligase [Hufsiella ginkgonis]|uniref:Peptidoglycan synthetase n=1 Tax=Hufsiella ginkgonis TaxID=2695274 RepID=A0A7K1XYP6_9SPHI|nr:Mur ligase family protein [Hufsiella ginkgonis]MXV15957.1 peptidoglycan synthetase [Hufsiella ginkgonis]